MDSGTHLTFAKKAALIESLCLSMLISKGHLKSQTRQFVREQTIATRQTGPNQDQRGNATVALVVMEDVLSAPRLFHRVKTAAAVAGDVSSQA